MCFFLASRRWRGGDLGNSGEFRGKREGGASATAQLGRGDACSRLCVRWVVGEARGGRAAPLIGIGLAYRRRQACMCLSAYCEGVRIAEPVVGVPTVARGAARHRARARTSRLRLEERLIAFGTRTVAVFARFSRYNAPSVTSGTDETLGCGVKGVWTPNAQRAWSELDIIVVFLARGRPVHCPSYSSLCFGIGA